MLDYQVNISTIFLFDPLLYRFKRNGGIFTRELLFLILKKNLR